MGYIRGITISIDGETKGLDAALKKVNGTVKGLQGELKRVESLLRMNPGNVDLDPSEAGTDFEVHHRNKNKA